MLTKLFTPGPVGIKEEVLKELSKPVLFHRSQHFKKLYKRITGNLNLVFDANKHYVSLILTGSGTMANEAVITSLIRDKDKLLIVSNGQFGERLAMIAKINKVNFKLLDFGWASPFDLKSIEKEIKKYKPNWLAAIFLETSVGMVNPIHEIGIMCKKYGVKFFVDAISALAAEELSVSKDYIDVCTSVPNKALEAPPGLSFICMRRKIIQSISKLKPKSYYLDLNRYYQIFLNNQTPTTPAVSLYFALDKALYFLLKERLINRRKRYKKLSSVVYNFCKKLNIPLLIENPKCRSTAITTIILTGHEFAQKLQLYLEKKGFIVWHHNYRKKDRRLNSLIQISVMGNVNQRDITNLFLKISQFLEEKIL